MLETFVGPCPEGMEARHLDGNPGNNHLTNLKWGTLSENQLDTIRHGTHAFAFRTECPRGHALVGENLSPWLLKRGSRTCLACARARAYIRKVNPDIPFKDVADYYYSAIMKGVA